MNAPNNPVPGLAERIARKLAHKVWHIGPAVDRVQAELASDPTLREVAATIEDLITTIDSEPTRTVRVSRREVTQLKQALAKLDALMKGEAKS